MESRIISIIYGLLTIILSPFFSSCEETNSKNMSKFKGIEQLYIDKTTIKEVQSMYKGSIDEAYGEDLDEELYFEIDKKYPSSFFKSIIPFKSLVITTSYSDRYPNKQLYLSFYKNKLVLIRSLGNWGQESRMLCEDLDKELGQGDVLSATNIEKEIDCSFPKLNASDSYEKKYYSYCSDNIVATLSKDNSYIPDLCIISKKNYKYLKKSISDLYKGIEQSPKYLKSRNAFPSTGNNIEIDDSIYWSKYNLHIH